MWPGRRILVGGAPWPPERLRDDELQVGYVECCAAWHLQVYHDQVGGPRDPLLSRAAILWSSRDGILAVSGDALLVRDGVLSGCDLRVLTDRAQDFITKVQKECQSCHKWYFFFTNDHAAVLQEAGASSMAASAMPTPRAASS